jgi:hypothetical protein
MKPREIRERIHAEEVLKKGLNAGVYS